MSVEFWLGFATGLAVAFGSVTFCFVALSWILELNRPRTPE